jgi:hypothetical protein
VLIASELGTGANGNRQSPTRGSTYGRTPEPSRVSTSFATEWKRTVQLSAKACDVTPSDFMIDVRDCQGHRGIFPLLEF